MKRRSNFKRIISVVLLMVLVVGLGVETAQSVNAASVTMYNSISALPKWAVDRFIQMLEGNTKFYLSYTQGYVCLKITSGSSTCYLKESAFRPVSSIKPDVYSFSKATTSVTTAVNTRSDAGGEDHKWYAVKRQQLSPGTYRIALSRMDLSIQFSGTAAVTLTGTIKKTLTFTYDSASRLVKRTGTGDNGIRWQPTFSISRKTSKNYGYMNDCEVSAVGEKTGKSATIVDVLDFAYSSTMLFYNVGTMNLKPVADKLFEDIGGKISNGTDSGRATTTIKNMDLAEAGYIYNVSATSPLYLRKKNDSFTVKVSMSEAVKINQVIQNVFSISVSNRCSYV